MGLQRAWSGPDGLVVIEASGKLTAFHRALERAQWNFSVVATLGHLHEWPRSLRHLGVVRSPSGSIEERERRVARPEVVAHLGQRLASLRPGATVVLATDDDDEGHAIAADVARLARDIAPTCLLRRAFPKAMTPEAIAAALLRAVDYEPGAEIPGLARRRVDRVIGGALSDLDGRRPVGRVLSALLDSIEKRPVSTRRQHHLVNDGAIDFLVDRPGRSRELATTDLALGPPGQFAAAHPPSFVDAIGLLEDEAGLDIASAAALLQELYVSGQIGYPRTTSRGFDADAAAAAEAEARRLGLARFSQIDASLALDVVPGHPAIALTEAGWRDLEMMRPMAARPSPRDRGLAALGRQAVASVVTIASTGVRSLRDDLRVVARVPGLPWQARHVPAERSVSIGRALVDRLHETGLGRPSTVVAHAAKAQHMGWVDGSGALTKDGLSVLSASPPGMDASASQSLEAMIQSAASRGADAGQAAAEAVEWLQDAFPGHADAIEAALRGGAPFQAPAPHLDDELEHDDVPTLRL